VVWLFHNLLSYWEIHAQPFLGFTKKWCEKGKTSCMLQSCGWKCLVDARGHQLIEEQLWLKYPLVTTEVCSKAFVKPQHAQPWGGWAKTAEDPTRFHSSPLQIEKRLQFARAHQYWTGEDWKKVAWSDKSRFLLRHSDGRVRIWRKQNENMDPSCLVTTVQGGGGDVMVWGMLPIGHRLNATAYLSIVSDHVHPFMATMYPSWWLLPAG